MDIRWIPLVGKTGYILAAGALIPTYILNDREIVLVDSRLHYDPGLVSFIRAVDVSVYAVLQTHLHEDHVANNRILISRLGTRIIAHRNEVEAVHSRQKMRASWSEIRPETKDKYLRTYSYSIESIENGQEEIVLRDSPFKIVPLYGHSEGHLGFVTPDGVLCTGDAILSPALVQHSKMPYFEDI
jgi:glyoxylase-like metal-dependent hydrolase (beta-lactamase superfamily II)